MAHREITTHRTSDFARNHFRVFAVDDPGSGGGNHEYLVEILSLDGELVSQVSLKYQHGPIKDGVNGILDEVLLAIVADRLSAFSRGEFASRETSLALTKVQEALLWMQERQMERARRGVQGELKR